MYEYIDHVLSNYFSAHSEVSEKDAIALLRTHLATSTELASGLRNELCSVFLDPEFSWQTMLADHDVVVFEDEKTALEYAKKILWEPFFHISES